LRFNNSLEDIFATVVCGQSGESVREYTTVKFGNFSCEVANNNPLRATVGLIPQGLNINTGTGTNDLTQLATVSLPTNAGENFANFNQLEVLINDASAGALTGGGTDDVYVSSVSLDVNANLPTDDVTTQFAPLIDEPVRDGYAQVTGTLNFSKLTDTSRITEMLDKTKKKMTWTFTGPIADATNYYYIKFWFSNVQFTSGTFNVPGPGRVPESINFKAQIAVATHTGFGNGDAMYVTVMNTQSTDPLA
jgi:hypothetical protein